LDSSKKDVPVIQTTISQTVAVPLVEGSGLALVEKLDSRGGPSQSLHFAVISDLTWDVGLIGFDGYSAFAKMNWTGASVQALPLRFSPLQGDAQFEAIQLDSQGHYYILSEATTHIFVYSTTENRFIATFLLNEQTFAELVTWRKRDPNSWLEGFVLLPNGHILAVKEKNPPLLIDFGPKGSKSEGYRMDKNAHGAGPTGFWKNLDLRIQDHQGKVPIVYDALEYWEASKSLPNDFDLSDLTVADDGQLVALSDAGQSILALEHVIKPQESKFGIKTIWKLPKEIEKPEGLVTQDKSAFFVLCDQKSRGPFLFKVTARDK
jgi:uncharacterized protein YjiK